MQTGEPGTLALLAACYTQFARRCLLVSRFRALLATCCAQPQNHCSERCSIFMFCRISDNLRATDNKRELFAFISLQGRLAVAAWVTNKSQFSHSLHAISVPLFVCVKVSMVNAQFLTTTLEAGAATQTILTLIVTSLKSWFATVFVVACDIRSKRVPSTYDLTFFRNFLSISSFFTILVQ